MGNDRLYPGCFFYSYHTENGKTYRHPFLCIAISKNKVVALQFTSVKQKDGEWESFFGNLVNTTSLYSEENDLIDFDINDGLDFWSQANLNRLSIFDFNHQNIFKFEVFSKCRYEHRYKEIIERLRLKNWNNELIDKLIY